MAEETVKVKEMRIYVGGLTDKVTTEDIKNTFNNLGVVNSVDFIRTKGRSFAYINFLPSSNNSLPKLFTTYNGCAWKGGKLKLEKAKEHYMDRLKREWAEEAELKNSELTDHGDIDANGVDLPESQSIPDLKNMEFRLFFPKLRKLKPLPLSGTGKHKYSFRRLEGPPIPVHICDCPEHSVPVQTRTVTRPDNSVIKKGGIGQDEYVNKIYSRETSSDHKKIADHDSEMPDVGLNEEEINMMESVMKKIIDRETSSKQDRKNPHFSREKTTTIDEGTKDDDIKINAVAAQNFSSFSFRSREMQTRLPMDETLPNEETNETEDDDDDDDIQINAGRNKRHTSLENEITKLNEWRNQKVKSSNRKRKSISIETNVDDMASSIHEKKGHLNVPLKKRGWKQLVGDGSSSSFTLSQITSENDTNLNDMPKKLGNNAPDIKKSKKAHKVSFILPTSSNEQEEANNFTPTASEKVPRVAPEDPELSDEAPAGWEEHEEDDKSATAGSEEHEEDVQSAPAGSEEREEDDQYAPAGSEEREEEDKSAPAGSETESQSLQQNKKSKQLSRDAPEEPKPSDEAPAGSEEHEENNNNSAQKESQSSKRRKKNKKARKVVVLEEPIPNDDQMPAVSEEDGVTNNIIQNDGQSSEPSSTRGSSWLQRSTWTQLVGGDNNSSFSISQILPGDLVQKQSSYKPDDFNTVSFTSAGAFSKEKMASEVSIAKEESKVASNSEPKPTSLYAGRGVQISESCPFMRNADSMKEWMTAKTSMSNSLKKMKNK